MTIKKIWQREISLELIEKRSKDTLSDYLGIEFVEIGPDYLTARMPVLQRTRQPIGIMHGGASCVMAETVGSTGAQFCVGGAFYCVGLEINTNHIRSIREGEVRAVAKPFHLGKSTQVWSIEITNEQGQYISINRLTMAVLKHTEG